MDSRLPSANDLGHLQTDGNSARAPTTSRKANVPNVQHRDSVIDNRCPSGHAAHEVDSELERLRCSNDAVTQVLPSPTLALHSHGVLCYLTDLAISFFHTSRYFTLICTEKGGLSCKLHQAMSTQAGGPDRATVACKPVGSRGSLLDQDAASR